MTLDGVAVTGSGVDYMGMHNAAFILPVEGRPGSFALGPDTPRQRKKRVVITNGKFAIPVSTSKMTPE